MMTNDDDFEFDFNALCTTPFKDVPVGSIFVWGKLPVVRWLKRSLTVREDGSKTNANMLGLINGDMLGLWACCYFDDDDMCWALEEELIKAYVQIRESGEEHYETEH